MTIPRPGARVRGSTTGRPIMAALDLLGRRWVLRILWELREEALTFRALGERCGGISPAVLNERLRDLREAVIVEAGEDGYSLSPLGRELASALAPLNAWSARWAAKVKPAR